MTEYLERSHGQLNRTGAVCPFVAPAKRAGSLLFQQWTAPPDVDAEAVVQFAHRMVDTFRSIVWPGSNGALHTLVAIVLDLPEDRLTLLDDAQSMVKTELVLDGLMLGQFHAKCEEGSARNPEFPVSRSPVPMLALRNMAFHDILFLRDRPDWFSAYARRYGDRYGEGLSVDPYFADLFAQAEQRWALKLDRGIDAR